MRGNETPCCEPLFWAFLTVSLALLSFAGITSGLALGLLSLNQVDLEVLIKAGQPQAQKNAAKIMPLVKNEHLLLCTLLIGKTLAMEALPIFVDTIFPTWAAILISGILVLAFVEIIPQAVCSRYGLSLGAKLSALVRLLALCFFPLSYPISKLLDLLLGKEQFAVLRRAELKTLVALHASEAGKGGELSHHETAIIAGALDLTQKTAIDAMTPISETFSLDINSKLNMQMMGLITSKGHSRIPVYSGDQKNIIGLILVKNLIFCHPEDETPIKYMTLRRMPRVYDNWPLYDILNQFLKGQSHMAIVVKSKEDVENVENNALVKSDMVELNPNPNLDPKEAGKKGLIFPLAEKEEFSFSTEASPLYSSEMEIQSATPKNVMEQDNNFHPQYKIWQQGGEIISAKDLESLPSNLDEEVIGIITLEDVLEALLQENILDETDAYIDVHNKIKINPQYSRILASGSPRRSSSSHLHCRNSDPSALSAYSHTPKRRSHSFSYIQTPIIRSTLSPSLAKSMNNSEPASAITPTRSAPSSHRLSRMSYEKLELPSELQSP